MNDKQYDEREACLFLKGKGLSRKEIAEKLDLTERQVKRRLSAGFNGNLNNMKFGGGIRTNVMTETGTSDNATIVERLSSNDNEYFSGDNDFSFPLSKDKSLFRYEEGDRKRQELSDYIQDKYIGKKAKILYLADLHIPFTMYTEVMEIIKLHKDADIVVINGDLLDLFAVSKFAKDKEVALRRELKEGREFLELLSKKFADVVITEGNHERRLKSFIRNIIPTDMQFLFPDDILQMVVSGEALNKKPLRNVHVVGSWWIKLFDTIFAHPDNYSSANLKTVQNTSEHFQLVKGINHRACVIGHTHRAGWIESGGILLMETGCLCHDMDYHQGSNFTRMKWTKAYATTEFNPNGEIMFNKSTVHIL